MTEQELEAHRATYRGFVKGMVILGAHTLVILAIMAIVLV